MSNTGGITGDRSGNRCLVGHLKGKFSLMSMHPHQAGHVFDNPHDGALGPIKWHSAGLDFGQVQDTVDEAEEVFSVTAKVFIPLSTNLRRNLGILDHLGVAKDRRHRGPDLVADSRQKRAFGNIGCVGRLPGTLQLLGFFHQLPLRLQELLVGGLQACLFGQNRPNIASDSC